MNFNISCIFIVLPFLVQNGMQVILNRNINIDDPKYGVKNEEGKIVPKN
jgi:hypothetical protein